MSNQLVYRDPKWVSFSVHGGTVAALAGMTTSVASGTAGVAVDSLGVKAGKKFAGVLVTVPVQITQATTTATGLQTVIVSLKDSTASGGTYVIHGSAKTTTLAIGGAGGASGAVARTVARCSVDLTGANRWVKGAVTFQAGAAATGMDQAASNYTLTFFGPDNGPADS